MAGFALHQKPFDRDRIVSGIAVALVHAALGWALLTGIGVSAERLAEAPLEAFDVIPPKPIPPPPPPVEKPKNMPEKSGRASPPNLKSKATPVVAPTPQIFLQPPIQVIAAPTPAAGNDRSSGNSNIAGPGTGSGGIGDGTGSGGWGDGPGGGGGGGREAVPINRSLGNVDCDGEGSTCRSVEVTLRFTVGVNGRVSNCRVVERSGDGQVDRVACPRAEERLRFRPELDRSGRPVPITITWVHEFDREPQLDIEERDRD